MRMWLYSLLLSFILSNPLVKNLNYHQEVCNKTHISASNIDQAKYAVGRFEWHYNTDIISHGTAFCIAILSDQPACSMWITCRHVAERNEQDLEKESFPLLRYKALSGSETTIEIKNIKLSNVDDIAVFVIDFVPDKFLLLAPLGFNDKLEIAQVLISAGCPLALYPPVVTVGYYIAKTEEGWLSMNVGGWYGSSGSPVIDLNSMQIVGMVHRFRRLPAQSDNICALDSDHIRMYLEYLKQN